jgi:hypothetical protein
VRLPEVQHLLHRQAGVVTRRQLLAAGVPQARIRTMLRRRELVRLHPGVYVTHTGVPTWQQRAWAAVLYAAPAALHLDAALGRVTDGPVDVAVDWTRRVEPQPGLRLHRVRNLDDKVAWNLGPPRVRVEVACVEVAHRAHDDLAAIAALADAVGSRRTTAPRLRAAIEARTRLRRRRLLVALLADLEAGTHSVLEHGFLSRVVRPHGLPLPTRRQAPRETAAGRQYRDVEYDPFGLPIELDGSTHDTREARDADADRDLDDLATGRVVPRLRYRQVLGTPCRTAALLGRLFRLRGWAGVPHPCASPTCDLRPERGGSWSDIDHDPPR